MQQAVQGITDLINLPALINLDFADVQTVMKLSLIHIFEEIRRKKNRRTSARRNQERALSMNRAFVAFLTACVAASAFVSVSLIQIRSNVTQQMKEVAALESQINDMKAEDVYKRQIKSSREGSLERRESKSKEW